MSVSNHMKQYSFYLYSARHNQLLTLVGTEAFVNALFEELSALISYGSNQMGRICVSSTVKDSLVKFSDKWSKDCPKVKALLSCVSKLNDGKYIYIVDATFPDLNRQLALIWIRETAKGHDASKVWDAYLKHQGLLKNKYDYYSFGFDGIKHYEGEQDKSKRECRFCHGIANENPQSSALNSQGRNIVKFGEKNNAHAISDAIGNKLLFCLEECVDCNSKLSKVERDFIYLMDWRRAINGIKNKEGKLPNVFGNEAALRTDKNGVQTLYVNKDYLREITGNQVRIRLNNKKIMTDQGAYRAICKYAINLMPSSYLPHFQQTIDWVAGRMNATKLPVVMTAYNLPHTDQPVLDLFFRRSDDNSQPLCTAMLYVCDMCYLYVLPFADTDKACVTHMNGLDAYWQPFCQLLPCAIWKTEDMSDFDISTPWIETSLPLTDGLKVKIVSSDDEHLRQPVSNKPSTKPREEDTEQDFPEFDSTCAKYTNTEVVKSEIVNTKPIPSDALHHATNKIGINIEIYLPNATASVVVNLSIYDPTGHIEYLNFTFASHFAMNEMERYVVCNDEYVAIDYHLRDYLFYTACMMADPIFKARISNTQYAICSLEKALCTDKRVLSSIYYIIKTEFRMLKVSDRVLHPVPYDV